MNIKKITVMLLKAMLSTADKRLHPGESHLSPARYADEAVSISNSLDYIHT